MPRKPAITPSKRSIKKNCPSSLCQIQTNSDVKYESSRDGPNVKTAIKRKISDVADLRVIPTKELIEVFFIAFFPKYEPIPQQIPVNNATYSILHWMISSIAIVLEVMIIIPQIVKISPVMRLNVGFSSLDISASKLPQTGDRNAKGITKDSSPPEIAK